MMSLKNFPERLKSARKMNGFSLQDLADKLDKKISKQALSKYETGQSVPELIMLSEISKALNVPQDYFFRSNSIELGNLSFRKLSKLSAKEQDIVIHKTKDFLERYLELEDILGIDSHFVNPVKKWVANSISDIEGIAERLRKEWDLGEDPLFNVIELLEDLKIKVFEIDADHSFSGMSTWVDNNLPVIVLNSNRDIPLDRKRFTALHELGHLVLNLDQYSEKEQEGFCHAFAGAMLIPKSKVIDELGGHRQNIFMNELFALKKQYGISIQAIMYRAKTIGLISDSYFKLFTIRFNQSGYRKKEPVAYEGFEGSNRFKQLLLRAVAEEFISTSKGAVLNNQKLTAFRSELV
jgi:Zn-dependent peptidase ImmA (M78 family)/DNA-binding XRE family transcriptional regulator